MEIKKGIEHTVKLVVQELRKQTIVVGDDYEKIQQVDRNYLSSIMILQSVN